MFRRASLLLAVGLLFGAAALWLLRAEEAEDDAPLAEAPPQTRAPAAPPIPTLPALPIWEDVNRLLQGAADPPRTARWVTYWIYQLDPDEAERALTGSTGEEGQTSPGALQTALDEAEATRSVSLRFPGKHDPGPAVSAQLRAAGFDLELTEGPIYLAADAVPGRLAALEAALEQGGGVATLAQRAALWRLELLDPAAVRAVGGLPALGEPLGPEAAEVVRARGFHAETQTLEVLRTALEEGARGRKAVFVVRIRK